MEFSDIGRNPLLRPDKIDEVLTYFNRTPNSYELAQVMPLVQYNTDRVQMDYSKARAGGMTPMVATGSESPIYGGFGRGYREFDAIEFREKCILVEDELVDLRKLGTKAELETARNLLQRKYAVLEERLANRLEWMRHQVLFNNQVSVETASGVAYTVDYEHPSFLEVTLAGTDLWSDYDDSDPLANLQEWIEDYVTDSGYGLDHIKFPKFLWRHLQKNDNFRQALVNAPAANAGIGQISEQLAVYAGLSSPTQIRVSEGMIHLDTELTAASASADTTLNLADVTGLEAGDTVYVASARTGGHHKEKFTVVSIAGNVVTVSAGVADATGFAAGDPVRFTKYTVPLNKILLLGRHAMTQNPVGVEKVADADKLRLWGEVATVLSRYVDFNSPKTGIFTKLRNLQDGDPPRWEQIIGVKALPKINFSEGWMTAQVLA